jgi:hypothetical protein
MLLIVQARFHVNAAYIFRNCKALILRLLSRTVYLSCVVSGCYVKGQQIMEEPQTCMYVEYS